MKSGRRFGDPVALVPMADRVKRWRPETDLYMLEGIGHWPSIEAGDFLAELIIHRLAAVDVPPNR